jgi:hypothetical protein
MHANMNCTRGSVGQSRMTASSRSINVQARAEIDPLLLRVARGEGTSCLRPAYQIRHLEGLHGQRGRDVDVKREYLFDFFSSLDRVDWSRDGQRVQLRFTMKLSESGPRTVGGEVDMCTCRS